MLKKGTHLNDWRDNGEEQIEALFEKVGFKIIVPEEHSPCEQIAMLMHCKELATTDGSIAHNAVFCTSGINLTIIRKADYWNSYQEMINNLANLNVTFIDAHKSVMVKPNALWGGPFYLCITSELEKYFNHYIPHLPLLFRMSWLKYRYKEPLKNIYYTFRAYLGIRTRIHKLFHI